MKNTILYHIAFSIAILVCSVFVAIMLYFIRSKTATKIYQESIILPYSISYVVISYIVYIFLNSDYGLVNKLLVMLGSEEISWYTTPKYWPVIFVIVQVWFGAGIKSVYYYGSLMAIDTSLFESAELDGCSPIKEFVHIVIPMIWPTVVTMMIVSFSRVFTEQWQVYTLLERNPANAENLGYFLYTRALDGNFTISKDLTNTISYSVMSAIGLILTAIILPLTLIMRWALNKFGPKAD